MDIVLNITVSSIRYSSAQMGRLRDALAAKIPDLVKNAIAEETVPIGHPLELKYFDVETVTTITGCNG